MPPEAEAVQVALVPWVIPAGETEQEPDTTGITVTAALACADPAAFVHVRVYVVEVVGETDTVPEAGFERFPTPPSIEALVAVVPQE